MVEEAALSRLAEAGWTVCYGGQMVPGDSRGERDHYDQVILERCPRGALACLSPELPPETLDDVFRRLVHPDGRFLNQ